MAIGPWCDISQEEWDCLMFTVVFLHIRKVLDHRDKVYEQLSVYLQLRNVIERLQVKAFKLGISLYVCTKKEETPEQNLLPALIIGHWHLLLFSWPYRKLIIRSYMCRWIWAVTSSLTQWCECIPFPLSFSLLSCNKYFLIFSIY